MLTIYAGLNNFELQTNTYASYNSTLNLTWSVTKYGEIYPLSTYIPYTFYSQVYVVRDYSTLMTPSNPAWSIAMAIISPIYWSLFADIEAICYISFLFDISLPNDLIYFTRTSPYFSKDLYRNTELTPFIMNLLPYSTIAWAKIVAVVVPSPACSLVFSATCWQIRAPRFSNSSYNYTCLAIVTPSFVIVGRP